MAQTSAVENSLRLSHAETDPLPEHLAGDGDDVRYPPQLVEHFVRELTRPGDVVLDPFAGFGTTAVVATELGRRAICIELLPQRAEFIRRRVPDTVDVMTGDARHLADLTDRSVDFVMTSPPYMTRNDHPQDPMTGYRALGAHYERYLLDVRDVFAQVSVLLKPGGHAVIDVANLLHSGVVTNLAWDIKSAVSEVLSFQREVLILSDDHPAHVIDEYCLVFRN